MITCARCNSERDESEFSLQNDPRYRKKWHSWCDGCRREYQRDHYTEAKAVAYRSTPEFKRKQKDAMLRHRYGISLAEFEEILRKQNGTCASCGSQAKLFVDHDHASGEVRSLLCHGCNAALGLLGEDPTRIRLLAIYAESI